MYLLLKSTDLKVIFIIIIFCNTNITIAEKLFKDLPVENPPKSLEEKTISTPTKTIKKYQPTTKKSRTKKPSTTSWFIDSKGNFWQFNSKNKKWQRKPLIKDM